MPLNLLIDWYNIYPSPISYKYKSSDDLSDPEELSQEAKDSLTQFISTLSGDLLRSMLRIVEEELPMLFEVHKDFTLKV